jgi:hypothetical protein
MFQEDQQPALAGSERKAQIFHEQWYHLRAQQHHRWIPNSVPEFNRLRTAPNNRCLSKDTVASVR